MNSTFYSGLQFSPCDHILDSDAARKLANHVSAKRFVFLFGVRTSLYIFIGASPWPPEVLGDKAAFKKGHLMNNI